jgi:hypothetical protein
MGRRMTSFVYSVKALGRLDSFDSYEI